MLPTHPTPHRRALRTDAARRGGAIVALAGALLLASCSSGGSNGSANDAGAGTTTPSTATSLPSDPAKRPCGQGKTLAKVEAKPLLPAAGKPGVSSFDLTSFDGTPIRLNWMPVATASKAKPAPTILMGPGWSETGDTSTTGSVLFASLSIPTMWDHGYNVVTWDPRGFGGSGGKASVNDAKKEGRDVQAIIDWLSEQPQAQQDRAGDPRVGMAGFSYGGGIQLTTAAIDCRVDAIVPGIAWRSLESSLYPNETVKAGWSNLLVSSAAKANLDPHIESAHDEGNATGTISQANQDWFRSRGPGDLVGKVRVPTLIIQGTVDNLFTLHEGIENYETLRKAGVPVSMIWFCGGHGACLTKGGDDPFVSDRSFAWLDRYLKGDAKVETGARFEALDQDGKHWMADDLPGATGQPVTAIGSGTLVLEPGGGSGGVPVKPGDVLGGVVAKFTPSKASKALEVPIRIGQEALLLGAPKLSLTYSGTQADGTASGARAFAQIVDDQTGLVVGNQLTPIPLELDGEEHTLTLPMEVIVEHVQAGDSLTLQLVADTTTFRPGPLDGSKVAFTEVQVAIPVAKGVREG
ncbi:MAG: CocE/NonD family hydrolase [Acidimicrobiales bacterium]